jgi:solute:Na+ symporter, SSS family
MRQFSTLDYLMVVLYLIGIAALGSSFYRRRSSARDYFLGGRSFSWLPAGISIVAADMSAITLMGSTGWTYKHNLQLAWMACGFVLMAPVAILVFVPFFSRLKLYTAYEYLERRFGLGVRLLASGLFQLLRGGHVAIAIYGPALVINLVTDIPVWKCILLMGAFTTFYTTLGGMKAVIWTDVIQFCTVMTGLGVICWAAIHHIPGGVSTVYEVASGAGKLNMLNLSTDPSEMTSLWACLIGGCFLTLAPLATDQAVLQRMFTTRSTKDCRQSVMLQAVINPQVGILLYLVGIVLFVFYQMNQGHLTGLNDTDAILPFFVVHELPSGVSGLVIAAIFAASMAVMSAGINALTTATTVDFYQRLFRPNRSSEHYALVGRMGTLAWGMVVTGLALYARHLGDLAIAYNRLSSLVSGPLLGVFLLGMTTRRATSRGALVGAAAGIAAVTGVLLTFRWSFFYHGPTGLLVTVVVGYLASLFTAPPAREATSGLVMGEMPLAAAPVNS